MNLTYWKCNPATRFSEEKSIHQNKTAIGLMSIFQKFDTEE